MAEVLMPQLGETVTEGTVTRWLKAVGESVDRDEPLFEVSTDKVDSEVPAPAGGVLSEIRVPEGETVEVGAVLAIIGGEQSGAGSAPGAEGAPAAAPAESEPASADAQESASAGHNGSAPTAAPGETAADTLAEEAQAEPARAEPQPPAWAEAGREAEGSSPGGAPGDSPSGSPAGLLLSPVVRRLVEENGLDPARIQGTGLGGRITRADVLAQLDERRGAGPSASPAPPRPALSGAPQPGPSPTTAPPLGPTPFAGAGSGPGSGADEVVPFTNIRRRTAEHMVRSKATSAHTLMVAEVDFESVETVRRTHGTRFREEEGFGLTYLPFVARATVEALTEFPHLNASVGDDALVVHHRVGLGIAVDLDRQGLIVPVVQRAEELTLRGLARRIRELAERARTRRLSADDISGGTFSITNPGPYGTLLTSPIINQPQVGILSTDGIKRRPVVVPLPDGSEGIAIHSVGLVSLVWDHRAVDGAYAAGFVTRVAELLATRDWAAEL